jgi:hypothetical protein
MYYRCVKRINHEVGTFIRKHRKSCILHVDFENLVLNSSGIFREGVYDDGIHFYEDGDVDGYCDAIADALTPPSSESQDDERIAYSDLDNASTRYWTYSNWTTCDGACSTQRRTAQCMRQQRTGNATDTLELANESDCAGLFRNSLGLICNIQNGCGVNGFLQDRDVRTMQPNSLW